MGIYSSVVGAHLGTVDEEFWWEIFMKKHKAKAIAILGKLNQTMAFFFLLDNLGVARQSSLIPQRPSQETFKQFRNLAKVWL